MHALGRLPFNQRAAITMRELEGRSHTEIAETLGVTVPAAEALIGRARRTLRSQAQAIKGLTVVQLPQSLRTLFRPGDAAGGAAGSAAIAKVVAVLAAGVVAGGVGLAGKGDAQSPAAAPQQRLEPRALVVLTASEHTHAQRAPVTRAAPAATHGARHAAPANRTYPPSGGRIPRIDTSGDAAPEPAHATRAADAAPATTPDAAAPVTAAARPRPVETVQTATTATATTVAQTVTTATAAATTATQPVQQAAKTVTSAVTTVVSAVPPPPPVTAPAAPAVPPPPPAPTVTIP
jgi:hypothetical protein